MLRRGPRRLPVNACPALGLAEAVRPGSTEDPGPAAAVKTGEELAVNHAGACRGVRVVVPRPRQPRLVTLTTIRRSTDDDQALLRLLPLPGAWEFVRYETFGHFAPRDTVMLNV